MRTASEELTEEQRHVEEALHCVETDSAGHWPTVASVLAVEVERLRAELEAVRTSQPAVQAVIEAARAWEGAPSGADEREADALACAVVDLDRAQSLSAGTRAAVAAALARPTGTGS